MTGLSMACSSDCLALLCSQSHPQPLLHPRPSLSFSHSQNPGFRLTSSSLSCKSRPFASPRSFFLEGAGPSATDGVHGQLTPKQSESSRAPKSSYDGQNEEEYRVRSHSRVDSSSNSKGEAEHDPREEATANDGLEDGYRMTRVADKLIEVFLVERTTPEEWRRLLAFSKEWSNIRPHFFKRCRARAEQELNPQNKGNLSKLSRKLKEAKLPENWKVRNAFHVSLLRPDVGDVPEDMPGEDQPEVEELDEILVLEQILAHKERKVKGKVDDDMERHNELFSFVKENEQDIDKVVSRRRRDFTMDFFQHLELIYQANYEQPNQQNDLAKLAQKCAAAVEAYDKVTEEEAAVSAAQMKFDDILNSPSLDIARNKIDELAKRNELDSTMMLLITKAWAASKESTIMKEEVKDILYHLYMIARGNMQRLVPKEVRILRHVLTLEDPKEQFAALTDAFSPGAELEGKDIDLLYTTPQQLHNWIAIVLNAYYNNQKNSLMKSAQELMSPTTIKRLETLKKTIQDQFL
ncbi:hypothetical protein L7F22_050621 [Adiantum nelumboides]|nr:hypothetical protein [Adiantum nelumboides]